MAGLVDALAIVTSIGIQYGGIDVLKDLVKKMSHQKFEPAGFTSNPNIRIATSLVDYIYRYLGHKFLPEEDLIELGLKQDETVENLPTTVGVVSADVPPCTNCGSMMVRRGTCYWCDNCGANSGSCSG